MGGGFEGLAGFLDEVGGWAEDGFASRGVAGEELAELFIGRSWIFEADAKGRIGDDEGGRNGRLVAEG